VTLTLARFTQLARLPMGRCAGSSPLRRMPSVWSRQGAGSLPCSTAKGSGWEPDGVTLQVLLLRAGNEPTHGGDIAAPPGNQAANR